MTRQTLSILFSVLIAVFSATPLFGQRANVGYDDLKAEVEGRGDTLEDGAGLSVMQAEASNDNGAYMAHAAGAGTGLHFNGGKVFTEGSGASGVLSHATSVGVNFYGNLNSLAPGITDITGYDANDYINNVLGAAAGIDPAAQGFDVGNHSYVARAPAGTTPGISVADAENLLERFDFLINRDNTVMVVGADNNTVTPRLWAPSFNSITVGLSTGAHSTTMTDVYEAPRFATELVVPDESFTSFAAPIVAGGAALLKQAGAGTNMVQNEVIRSTLFAGATKDEFASWDRTTTRPIDEVFGFGELNIQHSYHIWEGGEFEGDTGDPATNIGLNGWDYGDFNGTDDLHYDFTIEAGQFADELSAVLTWNMEITDNNPLAPFDASRSLADLNLELFNSSGSFLGPLVDSSFSTAYNHEHIYFQNLTAGDYTFRVSGDQATDFGFSWRINSIPEPGTAGVLGLIFLGLLSRRRRT